MPLAGCISSSLRVRRSWRGPVALLVLLAAAIPAAAQPVVPRPLGSGLAVNRADGEPPGTENPRGPLTLRDALLLALRQNPELAGYAWAIRAQESALLQAGRAPNPAAEFVLEDLGSGRVVDEGRVAQPHATLQLSQLIELGGKRTARRSVAGLDRDLAEWDFEAARIDVFTGVTIAFLDVLTSQQTVALAERTRALVEQVAQTVGSRVEAGVVSPIEQTKAAVALGMARIDEQRARRALAADRTALAALWGQESAVFDQVEGELPSPGALPPFEWLAQHLALNPEVARWTTEIARRDALRALESARGVPDVTVSAGYRRFTAAGANALVVGASIPLPFRDRNQAGALAAAQRASQARESERASRLRVVTALAVAYRDLAAAHDEAVVLAADVLPGARSAFAAVEEGYRLGRFGYLEVLDAQRTLVAAEVQHLRAQASVQKAVAHVERLTGTPFAEAATPPARKQ